MKIAVLGASGPTGQEIVKQALENGDQLQVLVRDESKLAVRHANLHIVKGDALDAAAVERVVSGQDAVISALGGKAGITGSARTTVYSQGAKNIVLAMRKIGIKRLVFCTSGGVEDHDPNSAWVYEHVIKPMFLQNAYDDMKLAEAVLWGLDDLECVIARPPRLTNGVKTGKYRVVARFLPEHGTELSRADLAHFMLEQVRSGDWIGKTPTLAY